MDDYVSKPLRPQDLYDAIHRVTGVAAGGTDEAEAADESADDGAAEAVVFDREGALQLTGGDEGLLIELAQLFLEDVPARAEELAQALADADAAAVRRVAHGIKGAAANLGGEAVRAAAFELEELGEQGRLEDAGASLARFEEALAQLREALQDLIARGVR
jgi:HPt (histidine-containing phosphotransfer) domain-containing protein